MQPGSPIGGSGFLLITNNYVAEYQRNLRNFANLFVILKRGLILGIVMLLACVASAQIIIKSDGTWKAFPSYVPNWNQPDFDDSSWGPSLSPSPSVISPVVPGSQSMWIAPYSDTVYFRKSFELKGECVTGEVTLSADNEFELYVNGSLVGVGKNLGLFFPFTITPYLRIGKNTIAIKAANWRTGPYLASIYGTVDYLSGPIITLNGNDTVCPGTETEFRVLHSYPFYQWNTGAQTKSIIADTQGRYFVETRDTANCLWADTVYQIHHIPEVPDLGQNQSVCDGDTVQLNLSGFLKYDWKDGDTAASHVVTSSGTYAVTTTDSNSCVSADSLNILVFDFATVSLGPDQVECLGDTVKLSAEFPQSSYKWNTGSQESELAVTKAGSYTVTVTNFCGSVSDNIRVNFIDLSTFEMPEELFLCTGESIVLDASVSHARYLWTTGDTSQQITVREEGYYGVRVKDVCGNEESATVEVRKELAPEALVPNSFTPNKDGMNERFGSSLLEGETDFFWFRIFDRWGQMKFESYDPTTHWDGENADVGTYTYDMWYMDCRNQMRNHVGNVYLFR